MSIIEIFTFWIAGSQTGLSLPLSVYVLFNGMIWCFNSILLAMQEATGLSPSTEQSKHWALLILETVRSLRYGEELQEIRAATSLVHMVTSTVVLKSYMKCLLGKHKVQWHNFNTTKSQFTYEIEGWAESFDPLLREFFLANAALINLRVMVKENKIMSC